MIHEEAYKVQYLYNSINEYLYFIIVYIEVYGPQHLNDLEKYVKFFNSKFQSFIQIFNGQNQVKRISNLLCTTTTAFFVKEETVHLSKSYESCKRVIFEDFIKSKVVDLVLRGVSSIPDIHKNINLNIVINIQEDTLVNMLKSCPYFYVDTDSSVTVIQFHGLIGFDNHICKTITEYFQSYLHKVDALTYDEINLHSRYVPSCGIQNSLVIFCVFYISDVFKCKNNKVSIKKNWKTKLKNQQRIDIDQLSGRCQDDVSISRLVFIAHGPFIQNWTGEIIHLNKSIGFIQCVVDFKGNYQGVFSVFFNFTALNFVCDTENLENYLNIRDTVEFDAKFCDKTAIEKRYWKALQVTVTKQGLRRNKYKLNIDTEEYIESIQFKNKLNPSLKSHLLNNQCINTVDYSTDALNSKQFSSCTGNFSSKITNFHPAPTNLTEQTEIFHDHVSTSSSNYDTTVLPREAPLADCSISISTNKFPILNRDSHEESNQSATEISPIKNGIFEINSLKTGEEINFKQHIQKISKEMFENFEGLPKNRVLIPNFLFSHFTFIFGEIVTITNNEGIAVSLNSEQCEVFFKTQTIFNQEDAKCVPEKGNTVLLFIPHGNKESTLLVATLVYVLDSEASTLVSQNHEWDQDFVIDYFVPKLKASICDPCNCVLSKGLFLKSTAKAISTNREVVIKCCKLFIGLKEIFILDEKTLKNFQTAIKRTCSHNFTVNKMKPSACLFSQLFKTMPYYFKFKISRRFRYNVNASYKSRQGNSNCQLLPPHLLGKKVCLNGLGTSSLSSKNKNYSPLESQLSDSEIELGGKNYSNLLLDRFNEYKESQSARQKKYISESGCASSSSLNSYVSCDSKSDESFYSCESLSGIPISDSDFKTNPSHIDYQTDSTEISHGVFNMERDASPEVINYSKPIGTLIDILVTDLDKKKLSPKGTTKNKIYNQNKKYLKFKSSSLKHTNKKKLRIIVESENNFCKCQTQLIETTASISTITNSCLLLSTKNNEQNFILSFPKCLIPKEIWTSMELNSLLRIVIVPHTIIQLSRILYVEFFPN